MENQPQSAATKVGYVVLTLELLLLAAGAAWYFLYLKPAEPEPQPAFEAVASAGTSANTWNLITHHSSGRDVLKLAGEEGAAPAEAMIGDAVDRWGDYCPEAGQFVLSSLEDPKLKPLVSSVRVTSDKGEIRALKFGPGVWMEGRGDAAQKPFPMELSPDQPGLAIFQLVRCQVEPNRTLTTVRLSNQGSGKPWASIRARPDGSFEALVGPEAKSLIAPGRADSFCVVSLTWHPKSGTYRFAVRPEGGFARQAKETKFSLPELEPADQMQLGDKLDAGGSSNGTMEVVETLVYRRELGVKDVIKVEDWLYNYYFSSVVVRGPFEWEAASPSASWGDEASWAGEGIPTANEEVKFTKVAKAEPITVKLDGNRQIKKLSFSNASPSWTLAEGSFPGARLNITDGDATGSENIDALATVDGTILNLQVAMGGFSGSANDDLTFLGDGGTVNFHKQLAARLNLGSSTSANRGMSYSLEAPNLIVTRFHAGFHDNPADAPVNGTVSTFVRVNQSQTTSADQIRVAGGGGSQYGVLTIQNKATWSQDKGSIYIGYSGSNGIDRRSNGRIEIGHPSSVGNLTIGNDVGLEIGESGGTGVIDVHNGTFTIKASNDTQTVVLGDRGSDQASGGGNGTINLNASGTILTARNFTRQVASASGAGKFNFNGGLLRLNRATGNVTKELIGPGITVTLSGPGARVDTNGNNTVLARDLSGSGGVEKLGKGTLTLTGKNSYKGETKVTAGILTVSGPALPASGTLQVSGGQVSLTGAVKVAKLGFAGAAQAAGTWGATGSGAKNIDDTHFTGTGVLTVGGG